MLIVLNRFTLDSGRGKKLGGTVGISDMSLFMSGHATHTVNHKWHCVSLHVCACHSAGVPTPIYTTHTPSWQGATILYNRASFRACGPTQGRHLGEGTRLTPIIFPTIIYYGKHGFRPLKMLTINDIHEHHFHELLHLMITTTY